MSDLLPVLSSSGMRAADAYAIDDLGLGGFTLMETAGRAVADVISDVFHDATDVLILCGKGNNGGDGLVAARYLADRGFRVRVATTARRAAYEGETADHLGILRRAFPDLDIEFGGAEQAEIRSTDIVVDSLLGTGISSDVREPIAGIIRRVNESTPAGVVAVDVPSGIDSDTGRVLGCAVRADVTVTMAAHKVGLLLGEGPDHTGQVFVADIGIPGMILDARTGDGGARLSRRGWVCARLPRRERSDHKYSTGPTLVVAGSTGFPGAAVLSARAAARIGSGYVVACCPADIRDHLVDKLTEIPVAAWPGPDEADPVGAVDALIEDLGNRWDKARSMLIGPGLGRTGRSGRLVMELLDRFEGTAVIDADALYLLRDQREWVLEHGAGRWILTPHMGEFQRLLERDEGIHDRIDAIRTLAEGWNATVLLKGMPSITAAPREAPIINSTGNPAAGTAGTGDVLAGIVAGLAAQGLPPAEAAAVGVHLAGEVADRFVEDRDERTMIAGDVVDLLPEALADLCRERGA
ncbi:MAG: NAD(P)H-hydrate dehydratase [Rhodothermales bacterium]|nr:NAD(P)H-hydrate dehydratase [Rhodothermales bacterium]